MIQGSIKALFSILHLIKRKGRQVFWTEKANSQIELFTTGYILTKFTLKFHNFDATSKSSREPAPRSALGTAALLSKVSRHTGSKLKLKQAQLR